MGDDVGSTAVGGEGAFVREIVGATVGSGVGLDTPASEIAILQHLAAEGHELGDPAQLPADGEALMHTADAVFLISEMSLSSKANRARR